MSKNKEQQILLDRIIELTYDIQSAWIRYEEALQKHKENKVEVEIKSDYVKLPDLTSPLKKLTIKEDGKEDIVLGG